MQPNERVIEELYQERLAEKSFGFRQLDAGVVNMITPTTRVGISGHGREQYHTR